jgi:hypothetical protein
MWKFGFASVTGTSHTRLSLPVQDACYAETFHDVSGAEILLAIASDGAGSASHSHTGAKLACTIFAEAVKTHFAREGSWQQLTDGFIEKVSADYQQCVNLQAEQEQQKLSDYACTLLLAIIGSESAAFFQLGDGAMVESRRPETDHYRCVCWPQQGEYANSTSFLTDADAASKVFSELRAYAIDEIALFTDGIQNLVLDYRTQSAHSPFFAPLFAWLRPRSAGHSEELSHSLTVYLNLEKINARTDDDKTLILASRRQAE